MKVLTVVGARPQFIKAAPVSRALKAANVQEYVVHTGQHYDHLMSDVFYQQLESPRPSINLGIGSASHGRQTGLMLVGLEETMIEQEPDWVLVYGDTNSTLAGALAAAKLHVPVAHVEAGLRSYNRDMPEEINRIVADHVSDLLFCPTQKAVEHLKSEGILHGVILTGDVMLDAFEYDRALARELPSVLSEYALEPKSYLLMTLHRASNTDNIDMLRLRLKQVGATNEKAIWPVHPRTLGVLKENRLSTPSNIMSVEPLGRLQMLQILENAKAVVTDSGGLQKEAYWASVPCFILQDQTEWAEIVEHGWNTLINDKVDYLAVAIQSWKKPNERPSLFGNGKASEIVVSSFVNTSSSAKAEAHQAV